MTQPSGTLDIGAVFERMLRTYRQTWQVLTGGALIVFAPIALLLGLVVASESGGAALLVVVVSIVGTFWYQGMVVETVRDVQDGKLDSSIGQLFRSVTPVLATLIAVGFLAVIGLVIGFILLIIPGLILLTIWAVIAPVVVIERSGVFEAFGRSRELVRGNGWQVFGVLVALFALNIALSVVASIIGSAGDGAAVVAQLLQFLIFAPVSALAASIVYFALREAHGDSVLAQPTGVLSGGFTPPVPPSVPETPAASYPSETPAAPATAAPAPSVPDAPAPPAAASHRPASPRRATGTPDRRRGRRHSRPPAGAERAGRTAPTPPQDTPAEPALPDPPISQPPAAPDDAGAAERAFGTPARARRARSVRAAGRERSRARQRTGPPARAAA